MPLTIFFHSSLPVESAKWEKERPDRTDCEKYSEKMTGLQHFKIVSKIVGYTIITLGLYWIRLKCSKSGMEDLKNLKARHIIHYISRDSKLSYADRIDRVTGKVITHISSKEQELRKKERAARIKRDSGLKNLKQMQTGEIEQLLSDDIRFCMDKVKTYREISKDIKEILRNKKNYFLEHLYKENAALTISIEKYLNFNDHEQTSFHFMQLLAPFLGEEGLEALLKKAISNAKNINQPKKSIYQERFEEFQIAADELSSKNNWFLSLRGYKDLFDIAYDLLSLEDQYSTKFIKIYEKGKSAFEKCLATMKDKVVVNKELKTEIKNHFNEWRRVAFELQKNMAPEIAENLQRNRDSEEARKDYYEVNFNLRKFLRKQLVEAGLDEEIQLAISTNKMNHRFIKIHEDAKKPLQKIKSLLENKPLMQEAIKDCEALILEAREYDKEAEKNYQETSAQKAFMALKSYHDMPQMRDFVTIILEAQIFLEKFYPKEIDPDYFEFYKVLKGSEFFDNITLKAPDKEFYKTFKKYFDHIIDYNGITCKILGI